MDTSFDINKIQEFMSLVGRLKHMKRRGWELRNVEDPETIAGHMYRMAMLSFLVDSKELDKVKVMQMALIHDLAECIVGDITPHCGVSPDEKHKMEDAAMERICELLGDKGPEMLNMFRCRTTIYRRLEQLRKRTATIYRCTFNKALLNKSNSFGYPRTDTRFSPDTKREYERQESPEAKYVKDLDRLDLLMQAYEYEERDQTPGQHQEFFNCINGKIRHPFVKQIAERINERRDALCNKNSQ